MSPVISPPQGTGSVTSAGIKDDSIVNADIKSDAAIGLTKLEKTVGYVLGQSAVGATAAGDTSDNTIATITVPANALGPNGRVRVTALWTTTNNGNNKTLRIKFGGTTFAALVVASTASVRFQTEVANRNATNSQVGGIASGGMATSSSAVFTSAHDTTVAQDVTITAQKVVGGDTVTLEAYLVEVLYGA